MRYPQQLRIPGARLERWQHAVHADGLAAVCADPEVQRFLGGPAARVASDEISGRLHDHWEVFGYGLWAVVADDRGTAGFVGACRAGWNRDHADSTEVGWRLARWAWGRGYATRGGAAGAEHAFACLGLEEVVAFVHPHNTRSLAVVERLGMTFSEMTPDRNLDEMVRLYRLPAPAPSGAARRTGG